MSTKPKTATGPLKKGAPITWTTGSRFGTRTNKGVVVCFVASGQRTVLAPQAASAFLDLTAVSNRDRYIVKRTDGSYCYANAKSVVV